MLKECEDQREVGIVAGEIVVCRETGNNGESPLTGDRDATQKRYAQETMLKGAPRAPKGAAFAFDAIVSDLSVPGEAEKLIASRPGLIVHLAAVVSGEAEAATSMVRLYKALGGDWAGPPPPLS